MSQYDATHVTTLSIHWQKEPSNTSATPSWSHAASHQSNPSKIHTGKQSSTDWQHELIQYFVPTIWCIWRFIFSTCEENWAVCCGEKPWCKAFKSVTYIKCDNETDSQQQCCALYTIRPIRSGITGSTQNHVLLNKCASLWENVSVSCMTLLQKVNVLAFVCIPALAAQNEAGIKFDLTHQMFLAKKYTIHFINEHINII